MHKFKGRLDCIFIYYSIENYQLRFFFLLEYQLRLEDTVIFLTLPTFIILAVLFKTKSKFMNFWFFQWLVILHFLSLLKLWPLLLEFWPWSPCVNTRQQKHEYRRERTLEWNPTVYLTSQSFDFSHRTN